MKDDDTDSLVRAIAAAPALSPPAHVACVLAARPAAGDLARVTASLTQLDGTVEELDGGSVATTLVSANDERGAALRAAECALALRASLPGVRLALATGRATSGRSAPRALRDRAAVLLAASSDEDPIRVDGETAALVEERFATRVDGAGFVLVAAHAGPAPASAPAPQPSRDGELVARAIEEERIVNTRRLLWIVVAGTLLGLVNNVLLLAGAILRGRAGTEPRLTLPVMAFWVVLAVVRVTAMRLRPSVMRWALYSLLVVDIPLYFFMQYRIIHVVEQPLRVAAATLEFGVVLAAALQFFMQPRIILAATALLLGGLTLFFVYSGAPFLFGSALIDLGSVAAMGIYAQSRTRALLARAVDESAARVRAAEAANREVRTLNDELRRQVADRSRELAEALARLAGAPRIGSRFTPGDLVDERYRIVRAIGAGAMGQVYEVERVVDGRHLALKVLTGVADSEALARFAREAQIAAELDHPGVVAALDLGVTPSGTLFVVMELVAGSSLAASRARYGDAAWALPILQQIAAALSAMHARGIVHRDLKPSNVLVDGGSVKVADFGLASVSRSRSWDAAAAVASTDAALTRTGAVMGTPLYMAPELADGARNVEPSSDVFSLGVVAYELLANRLPHAAPPVIERLSGRAAPAAAPLGQVRPDLSSELSALVDCCVALSPEQRPSAAAVAAALSQISSHPV